MRTACIETLHELARQDRRITLVVGDLGFGVVTKFAQELPAQYVNAGVAEQNMTGLAVGLALEGKIAFTYSIGTFPVMRCMEQVRNDVCYHAANVKIVTVGGGLAYGALGVSHSATEDLAVMRARPNMTVVAPNDPAETRAAVRAAVATPGPFFLRLGRAGEPDIHTGPIDFRLGKAIQVRDGADATLVAAAGMLGSALEAATALDGVGVRCRVLSMHTLKPLDADALNAAARETGGLFTLEEHSVIGGLGAAVAECLLESDVRPRRFKRLGLPDAFCSDVGDQSYLRGLLGLGVPTIVATIKETLGAA